MQKPFCKLSVTLGREMIGVPILPREACHFLVFPHQHFDPATLQCAFDSCNIAVPNLIRNPLHAIIAAWLEDYVRGPCGYFRIQCRQHLISSLARHARIDHLNVKIFSTQKYFKLRRISFIARNLGVGVAKRVASPKCYDLKHAHLQIF